MKTKRVSVQNAKPGMTLVWHDEQGFKCSSTIHKVTRTRGYFCHHSINILHLDNGNVPYYLRDVYSNRHNYIDIAV